MSFMLLRSLWRCSMSMLSTTCRNDWCSVAETRRAICIISDAKPSLSAISSAWSSSTSRSHHDALSTCAKVAQAAEPRKLRIRTREPTNLRPSVAGSASCSSAAPSIDTQAPELRAESTQSKRFSATEHQGQARDMATQYTTESAVAHVVPHAGGSRLEKQAVSTPRSSTMTGHHQSFGRTCAHKIVDVAGGNSLVARFVGLPPFRWRRTKQAR
mmetsp:Transcript_106147/g.298419  ORF Transcript_106147/g.298419 Transcript_106147/m.298419 type:complete len:214 (-) Transcript_106147:922-1563(-)